MKGRRDGRKKGECDEDEEEKERQRVKLTWLSLAKEKASDCRLGVHSLRCKKNGGKDIIDWLATHALLLFLSSGAR
jgi:hypothetical protein